MCSYCQGFGEVAQALVFEARVYAVAQPFNEDLDILVTTLSVAFPCIEY